ncbi:unnamed protein product [Auanema sp. JU1783]|nr:unnamed protein product [Auanema sp. JU1783]
MPVEGVLNEHGFLFHHTALGPLNFEHKLRLLEYGVKYQEQTRFTPEEDERIRKNWKKFAKKHGYRYEDGRYYSDFWTNKLKRHLYFSEKSRLNELNMLPSICKWLEHRSAGQVMRRMMLIFDPHHVGVPTPFSDEEILLVYTLKSQHKSTAEIADELKRPVIRVQNMLKDKKREWARLGFKPADIIENPNLMEVRVIRIDQRRRFFFAVLKKLGISIGAFSTELINTLSMEAILKSSEEINLTDLIPSFGGFNEENLKNTWQMLCKLLLETYKKLVCLHPDDTNEAWRLTCLEVMPCFDRSVDNYIIFLKTLQNNIDESARVMKTRYINLGKLGKKLFKKGVIQDLESFTLDEYPGYLKLKLMLGVRDKFFFQLLELQLTVREKLEILIQCFEKLKQTEEVDPLRFPSIHRTLFVETAIEVIRSRHEDWYPPKCLQKWVRSADLVDLFHRSRYTTETSNSLVDILTFRQMTAIDEKQLLSLSKSGGVASALSRLIPVRVQGELNQIEKTTLEKPRKRGWQETSPDFIFTPHPSHTIITSTPYPQRPLLGPTSQPPELEFTPASKADSELPTSIKQPSERFLPDSPSSPQPKRLNLEPIAMAPFTPGNITTIAPSEAGSVMSYGDDNMSEDGSVAQDTGLIHIPTAVVKAGSPQLEATGWDSLF